MARIFLITIASLALLQACGSSDQPAPQNQAPAIAKSEPVKSQEPAVETEIRDFTERLFQNPFDADAVYLLSQRVGTPKALKVLIKRDSQDGTQYSRWQFNCREQIAQNLGVASNLQDLEKSINSTPAAPQHYEPNTRLGAVAAAVCPT